MLPQSNACLRAIAAGGTSEDWDAPAGADNQKWGGSAAAYYLEKRERVSVNGDTTLILRRTLLVETSLSLPFEEGDDVSFTFDGTDRIAKVRMIERSELAGVGSVVTTRLTMEEA